ncbi:MAG: Geranylgeranyl pyrophosphate synthase [Candidatus Yanofskybacteria bacterium GW2011_GWA1_48_10]|uniref:Geranylgeranyl pyrophosphate synthase n=1 Tax=Candidatus Yanofskybacteria bacterium GW2011_GWA1_48_10 TaxID=1619022 RepID=A0A0G1U6Y1_9BACT|nr:MAG: Geranylgeranyl pyrophosphate synthase [Candidatus Yanofskybacteria bacterium GW2011_GWA1_48_10]
MVTDQLARSYLKNYIFLVEPTLQDFLSAKLKEALKISQSSKENLGISEQMIKTYQSFIAGGKKLRGSLIFLGFDLVHKRTNKDILFASIAIEILHAALLMHDDIMDQDPLRRGMPTIHKRYEEIHRKNFNKGSTSHYGLSMGIDLGDDGIFMAIEVLATANLPEKNKNQALTTFARLLQQTAFGQAMDVTYELLPTATEEDVLRIHTYKTAFYTIAGPLAIGATLAGAPENVLSAINDYGKAVGVAFQLRDDELGLYSSEDKLGKPIGSDVREGKNTVLRIKAIELSKGRDRNFLLQAYGNEELSAYDVKRVQSITKDSGALAYSQQLSRRLVEKGKRAIPEITSNKKYQDLLTSFAELMITRDS